LDFDIATANHVVAYPRPQPISAVSFTITSASYNHPSLPSSFSQQQPLSLHNMVKEKKLPVGHAAQHSVHKIPLPTDNSTTMAQSAKPKSSTSEAIKTQTKKQKITRYIDSDDEDDEPTISKSTGPKTPETKPGKSKTNITKQQVSQKPSESDDEDEEGDSESEGDEDDQEESEDDQTNRKEPVKATSSTTKQQASSKKPVKKRALDSEDDEVVHMASKDYRPRQRL
jgi:hypothetical protein